MTRYINRRNEDGKVLAFYIPKLREYIHLTEKDFKECILKAGGSNNNSGVFLHPTKEATEVNSRNGINRRSVSMMTSWLDSHGVSVLYVHSCSQETYY